jgi:uncharacterized membrane protein
MVKYTLSMYCERAGDAHWFAEPLNFISNIAYIIASVAAYRHYRAYTQKNPPKHDVLALILLLGIVGIGSGLWHSLALPWTMYGDIIPIMLFVLMYFGVFLTRELKFHAKGLILFYIGFIVTHLSNKQIFAEQIQQGSTLMYLPPLLAITAMMYERYNHNKQDMKRAFTAVAYLVAAMFFRSSDLIVCDHASIGTHFLWHICTAIALYRFTLLLMR